MLFVLYIAGNSAEIFKLAQKSVLNLNFTFPDSNPEPLNLLNVLIHSTSNFDVDFLFLSIFLVEQ